MRFTHILYFCKVRYMRESQYQSKLIKKIKQRLPGCVILKNDPEYIQGIPDLVIFFEDRYAFLEVKIDANADEQPNQGYYVDLFNEMSFGAFIFPEIEEEVLDDLQRSLSSGRSTRLS